MTPREGLLERRDYRLLFSAQVVALLGTGLLTVALTLLAYDVAPGSAGVVVAGALTVKMVAYVVAAPVVTAWTASVPPRVVLVAADAVRVLVALALPWVDEVWHVYVLVLVLQAASATFTPTYQALLPTVLPRRDDYVQALANSRLAYDLEAVLSPLVAAAALLVISYHGLFVGTAIGFAFSAVLVLRSGRGRVSVAHSGTPFRTRVTAGMGLFARRRQLQGLLALDLAVAGAIATVLVNTVVVVRQTLGLGEGSVAVALGAFGAGSMLAALALPRVLRSRTEREVMLTGAVAGTILLVGTAVVTTGAASWAGVLVAWFGLGAAASAVLTPSGQVIASAVDERDRPAVFAAHFSLSHACYLLAYPVAGWVGGVAGVAVSALVLAGVATLATIVAVMTWSADESQPGDEATTASLDHAARPDGTRLRHGAEIFAMLGEPTRLELLWLMTEGPATVTELVAAVGASRTSVSQHLAKLRRAGVVDVLREGRTARYSLRGGHVERLVREGLNQADHVVSGERPHG